MKTITLSWNEIRDRAFLFQKEWENAEKERSEAQSFYNEFFEVFGVKTKRRVAFLCFSFLQSFQRWQLLDLFYKCKHKLQPVCVLQKTSKNSL